MKIKIITDSGANLTPELAKRFNIDIIHAYAIIDDVSYRDDDSIPPQQFYDLIQNAKSAKTSQPTPNDVWEVLVNNIEFDHLLMVHISEKLSGTINVVTKMAKKFQEENPNGPKITIFDSKGASVYTGTIAIKAAQLLDKGKNLESIIQQLTHFRDNDIQNFTTLTDLTHVYKSGRIGRIMYFFADILHAYPIMALVNGEIKPVTKEFGVEKTCKKLLEELWKCFQPEDELFIWVAETIPRKENDRFIELIKRTTKPKIKKVEPFFLGNSIVCHLGVTALSLLAVRNFDLKD